MVFSRRRSISIIVSPEKGVTVRAPYRTPLKAINNFVNEKSEWISRHLENQSDLKRINHGKKYTDGETHLFLGIENHLRLVRSEKQFVRQYDTIIEVGLNNTDDKDKIKALLFKWFHQQAYELFGRKIEEIRLKNRCHNFNPAGVAIRSLKSRWGSCSSKGKITLNAELIKLEERFTEYVIIHELCHLKHHNHGKEYYRLLEELIPDYKSIRKDLRKYITK